MLDLVFHLVVSEHRTATFNPERWAEHRQMAAEAKRATTPPPPIPWVSAVALRPVGWPPLTAALTQPPEPPVEEVEGHEAHVRLQAVINGMT